MSDAPLDNDTSPHSDDSSVPHVGFVVSVEQLALLRDLLSTQQISVVIDDCSNSTLLDDQWKPWARRIRTQLKQVSEPIIVRAPSYIFPEPHQHPKIRDTIASQLQAVCDLAVVLAAHKIIIPIEAGIPTLYRRICHYLEPLATRIHDQQMTLILETGIGTTLSDISAIQQLLTVPTERCMTADTDDMIIDFPTDCYVYIKNIWADNREVVTHISPTCTLLIWPTENTLLFRQYWEARGDSPTSA
jgi:hypothetical protein